ncbi:hypothetical protein EV356DRAFT_496664 [Viridothelium virens]|uniref:Trypsin-like serine protease n=1 Tax=Viridothelium virens TaxID=1048519 RepID=A0A6A6HGR3_VIRVR|nr:hypothetical protein EV356DRAFT_496664 [Viridothelium virens]
MRVTRSKAKELALNNRREEEPSFEIANDHVLGTLLPRLPIKTLPNTLTSKETALNFRDQKLLQSKQHRLKLGDFSHPAQYQPESRLLIAAEATLVFAQEAAGTAVCISPEGLLLTCSHCVVENREQLDEESRDGEKVSRWLLFASGTVVQTELLPGAWDDKRDLALLKIVKSQQLPSCGSRAGGVEQQRKGKGSTWVFPYATIATDPPKLNDPLICVGHPGSEDLEASSPGLATEYDVLHISEGRFRGYAKAQDLQDNSEIGSLSHTCWTYWGHSGSPLFQQRTGKLSGLHSSWDDKSGMRRGIPLEAIQHFLQSHTALVVD